MTGFNLIDTIANIASLKGVSNYQQNIEVFLIKVTKSDNEVYKQEADDQTKEILFSALVQELESSRFKNREVIAYDTVISNKNTHELVSVSDFPNIREMLNKFNESNQHLISTKSLDETQFHYYLVTLKGREHTYKVIGSFSNILQLQKKFLFGNFTDSKIDFTKQNSVFGFSKKIDLLVVDDEFVVVNQAESKFESIFKMNELFSSVAEEILNNNERISQVFSEETRQRLIKKVRKGKRMATRLIKITSDVDRFNKTIENISKLQDIIADEKHKFHNRVKDVVLNEGQLSVEDGKEIQLLDAISDAFYQAVISETENVDESRM